MKKDGAKPILESLPEYISDLNLAGNKIQSSIAGIFKTIRRPDCRLQILNLEACYIGNLAAVELVEDLQRSKSIKYLN